jgi:phospholipase C
MTLRDPLFLGDKKVSVLIMSEPKPVSRRAVLGGALALGGLAGASAMGLSSGTASAAIRAAKKAPLPGPGSLPYPGQTAGTETEILQGITNIVAVMMENHTYDSILGMLPVASYNNVPAGFTLDDDGNPTNANPWNASRGYTLATPPYKHAMLKAFPMSTACQLDSGGSPSTAYPWNTWQAGKTSYAGGKMDGFVKSQSGPVSMGYYDSTMLPFVNSLASTFPVCTRFFSSVMAQTYPNRRFFMAGTSAGMVNDTLNDDSPGPNGTIFDSLNKYGISWKNYYSNTPSTDIWIYNYSTFRPNQSPIADFYSDCAAGTLPSYSMVDPNFEDSSEEDPQDVQNGDYFLSQVINAVMSSPQWPHTLLVWTYDEGGGYYDHVPPPKAVKPDDVAPVAPPTGTTQPHGTPFNRYGFRVPSGIVSPYAIPGYVSNVTHDFTSILKLIETKWNLPALTYRDAQASNLLDSLDLTGEPAFLTPPTLTAAINNGDPATNDTDCQAEEPISIPPLAYVYPG